MSPVAGSEQDLRAGAAERSAAVPPADATPPPPAPRARATPAALARIAIAWTVGAALLAWLARDVDWALLTASVRNAPRWAWAITVLGLLGSYLLRALRIHAELGTRHRLTVPQCLEVMLIHNSAVNLLPMRGGEAAYPWLMKRRLGVPLDHAAASLVWMRLQDALVLALAALAVWPGVPAWLRIAAAAALVAAVAVGLRLLQRLAAMTGGSGSKLLRVAHRAVQALALAPRHGWRGWAYCGASWTVKLTCFATLLSALSGLPLAAAATGALGGELAGVLPLQGPANLGTYEAGVVAGAALRGAAPAGVVVPAIAVHLVGLVTAVLSGSLAYALSHRRSTPRTP